MRRPLLALTLLALAAAGCGGSSGASGPAGASGDALAVTVALYPYAFVAERVGGDDVEVTNLTAPGVEPHDLELTPQQVAGLSETDLVLYAAGFQPAVDEAVAQQAEGRALDVLTTVELREGAAHEEEGPEGAEEHAEEASADPHVWLDPTRLSTVADAVAERLGELDPDRAEAFAQRAQDLAGELAALDDEMRSGLATCERRQIVTSHDAFGYLAEAYDLEQVSLSGLSPDDEASPKRLAEVATYAEQNGVTTIFFEELVSPKVAQSLAGEVGAQAKVLSPLEGAPESGDYLSAMRTNLADLRTALGCS